MLLTQGRPRRLQETRSAVETLSMYSYVTCQYFTPLLSPHFFLDLGLIP